MFDPNLIARETAGQAIKVVCYIIVASITVGVALGALLHWAFG